MVEYTDLVDANWLVEDDINLIAKSVIGFDFSLFMDTTQIINHLVYAGAKEYRVPINYSTLSEDLDIPMPRLLMLFSRIVESEVAQLSNEIDGTLKVRILL